MGESEHKMFELIDDLNALYEDGIAIFPGRILVNAKELRRIVSAFPNAVSDEIQNALLFMKKKG